MKIVPIETLAALDCNLGFSYVPGEQEATFFLPAQVRVFCDGTSLHFFPERSSTQKRILAELGLN